jgi:hypothetical protein
MDRDRTQFGRGGWVSLALAASCACALAATEATPQTAAARYQQERAMCLSGQSNQDRDTCLKEAGAAFAQAKQGGLDDGNTPFELNALKRCAALPDADRPACVARMQGQGTISGSVAGGGIYREILTTDPAPPAAARPAATVPAVPAK